MVHSIGFRQGGVDPKLALQKQKKFVTVDVGNGPQTFINLEEKMEHFSIAVEVLTTLGIKISQPADLKQWMKGAGLVVQPGAQTYFRDLTGTGAMWYSTGLPSMGIDYGPSDKEEADRLIQEIRAFVQALFPSP